MKTTSKKLIITILSLFYLCLATLSYASTKEGTVVPFAFEDSPVIRLGTNDYIYRWSKADMHEFTPKGQEDLSSWKDMLTILVLPEGSDRETLARVANNLLSQYQRNGKIIRTNSVPRTASSEAEHLLIAVLRTPELLEAVFARMKMTDEGKGILILWAHRIYGKDSLNKMETWLKKNISKRETTLMTLKNIPTLDSIGK